MFLGLYFFNHKFVKGCLGMLEEMELIWENYFLVLLIWFKNQFTIVRLICQFFIVRLICLFSIVRLIRQFSIVRLIRQFSIVRLIRQISIVRLICQFSSVFIFQWNHCSV